MTNEQYYEMIRPYQDALNLLMARLEVGDLGGAEDLLFEAAESGGLGCLEAGVDFYARLNELTDAQLEEAGFGRDEIQEGLQDLSRQLGVVL